MMAKIKVELDANELIIIHNSLVNYIEGLRSYIKWIEDRPQLPEREVAIGNLRNDIKNLIDLDKKIYESIPLNRRIS